MIVIDYQDRRPLYEQIVEKFQRLIMKGALQPDSQLPSVRKLAMELSINPNTIQKAYASLEQQGFIYPVKGRGNFVSPNLVIIEEKKRRFFQELDELLIQGREMGLSRKDVEERIEAAYKEEDL